MFREVVPKHKQKNRLTVRCTVGNQQFSCIRLVLGIRHACHMHTFPCVCAHLRNSPELVFLSSVWLVERQTSLCTCLHSESNIYHIKDVWLVLCSFLKSLNTLFNHASTHLAASPLSAMSVPQSEIMHDKGMWQQLLKIL